MRRFWSDHVWEALACLAASAALTLTFSQGFYIPDAVADSVPLALLVCGGTLLYCYLGSFSRRTAVGCSIGFLGIAAGFFLLLGRAGVDIVDREGSPTAVYIYFIAAPLIAAVSFLLTRSRLGTAVWFLLGGCLHSLCAFLGFAVRVWYAALFALAAVTLFLLRQYRTAARENGGASPGRGLSPGLPAGVGLAGLLLALLCWTLVIQPLRPPVLDVKLLTRYMRYEVLEMVGIARQYPVLDGERPAPQQDRTPGAPEASPEAPPEGGLPPPEAGPDPSEASELGAAAYGRLRTAWRTLALALAALALLPLLVRTLRRRRLARLARGTPREQTIALYRFYLTRFARIGYGRAPWETEREYAARCAQPLAPYLKGGTDLQRMTELYLDARYGGLPAAQADAQALAELYPVFLRNYRTLAGRWRYWTKSFVL